MRADNRLFTNAGFTNDAPDGHYAFVAAMYSPCPSGNVPCVSCDTSEFAEALGLNWNDDKEYIQHIVDNGNPAVIAAIIQEINTQNP